MILIKKSLMTFICVSSARPATRKLVSSKYAPLETIQPHLKHFSLKRNNNDVNLDGNVWCINKSKTRLYDIYQ